ncbi:MAG: VOC family protein, partial [Spirochaetota bacterium]
EILTFNLAGSVFQSISAGPYFKFTPAVSFLVACETAREVDDIEARLRDGGSELMPLGSYPFSERYAWVIDRYGLSWQIMAMGGRKAGQKITPTLMFVGSQCGRSEEALIFYVSLFGDSAVGDIERYGPEAQPNAPTFVKHASFSLAGRDFAAMDSAQNHDFSFNEAISFMVFCDSQAEIDRYWSALSAEPEAERCGWLKDRFGLSWQIVPTALERLMGSGDEAARGRVMKAFLAMKKFDIAGLERAAL